MNGNGRSGRGESWMSRGESGGLLCWDGGVVACGTTKNSSIGARGGSGGDVGGEGCDDDCGRELMGKPKAWCLERCRKALNHLI